MKLLTSLLVSSFVAQAAIAAPIKVVVWDEQQPAQKDAYPNFLGNQIASYLETVPNLSVKSVNLGDPEQGLSDAILDECQVLIWWGHVRHGEVKLERAKRIVQRIKEGNEPFHVPTPDAVIFEEKWDRGEHFRSGCVWNIGKGKVFYFRPGHETYKVYFEPVPLKILANAVLWLGSEMTP